MAYMRQIGALVEPIAIENLFLRDNSFLTFAGVKVNYMSQGMSNDVFSKSDLLFPLVNEKKNEKGGKKNFENQARLCQIKFSNIPIKTLSKTETIVSRFLRLKTD